MEYANTFLSRNPVASQASSAQQITSTFVNQTTTDNEHKEDIATNDEPSSHQDAQTLILRELRRANAMAERDHAEAKAMHTELRALEEQRFKMTQMFIERSLTLQKQMLDCLRSTASVGALTNGNLNSSMMSCIGDGAIKLFPKTQSTRPQFVLSKKKK